MSIQNKLTKLEKRLGATRCPHCGATALRCDGRLESQTVTDAERAEVVTRFLNRYFDQFDQEQLLQRLADADPAKRQQVAHIYPLPTSERASVEAGTSADVVALD